jgi:hypothetical protein
MKLHNKNKIKKSFAILFFRNKFYSYFNINNNNNDNNNSNNNYKNILS